MYSHSFEYNTHVTIRRLTNVCGGLDTTALLKKVIYITS